MITYYLTLSKYFPATHKRAGQPTGFRGKIFDGLDPERDDGKIHTIRANYEFWRKRFEKIAKGEACLSIRQWLGKPYAKGSSQVELVRLTREDGIGLQKLQIVKERYKGAEIWLVYIDGEQKGACHVIAELTRNDGLSFEDWKEWFKDYNLNNPMAIIHFTKFRY